MSWGSDILYYAKRNPFVRAKISYSLKKADALICDCETVRSAAEQLGYENDRAVIFPWGVDLDRFSPRRGESKLRANLGWQNAFVIVHLRSWEQLYDPETSLRGFLLAAKREPRLRLLLPGAGSFAQRLRKLLAGSGLADRVHLPGRVSQDALPDFYRAADLYLSASRSDGSSVSLMEALACGLPALVTDIASNREWVSVKNGWTFRPGHAEELADKIVEISKTDLKQYSKQARKIAEHKADWQKNKLGLTRAYDLALESVR
jgi:glycosyltransferase involved in cell wall biosynthesis